MGYLAITPKPSHFLLSVALLPQTGGPLLSGMWTDKLSGHVCIRKMIVGGTGINRLTGIKGYSLRFDFKLKGKNK